MGFEIKYGDGYPAVCGGIREDILCYGWKGEVGNEKNGDLCTVKFKKGLWYNKQRAWNTGCLWLIRNVMGKLEIGATTCAMIHVVIEGMQSTLLSSCKLTSVMGVRGCSSEDTQSRATVALRELESQLKVCILRC